MAWSWQRKSDSSKDRFWTTDQSQSKRRKLEDRLVGEKDKEQQELTKDDWNDDEEFTSHELEELDFIASQAINQSQRSFTAQKVHPQNEASFAVPTGLLGRAASRSGSSSDSSAIPRSLSSRSTNETSVSLSSSSSVNGKLDNSHQSNLDEERKRAQEEKYRKDGEIRSLRDRLRKQEDEIEKLRANRDEKAEQEKIAQMKTFQKLQLHSEGLTSQLQFKDRENQSLQEKNNMLLQKIKKLQQQCQAANGQSVVCLTQSQKSPSPRKIAVQPSPPSKQKQQEIKEAIGHENNVFPTTHSFMEQSRSTGSRPVSFSVFCQTTGLSFATKPPTNRRLHLNAQVSDDRGVTTGCRVMSHLLQPNIVEGTTNAKDLPQNVSWDPGLVSLLHDMSTSLKIASLTYSRSKDSSFLTPRRPMRHQHGILSCDSDVTDNTVQVVPRQNLQLAIEGLTQLLNNAAFNRDTGEKKISHLSTHLERTGSQPASDKPGISGCVKELSHAAVSSLENINPVTSKRESPCKWEYNSVTSGAVMLLPLLKDYIKHYVDLVNSALRSPFVSPGQMSVSSSQSVDSLRCNTNSSSCDSSFDLLGSQLGQLLHDGKVYASCVEMYALTAIRCLSLLIKLCWQVGDAIIVDHSDWATASVAFSLDNSTTSSSLNLAAETEQSKKSSLSSGAADDEHSTSSTEVRVIVGASNQSSHSLSGNNLVKGRTDPTLLLLIIRLAGQDMEDNQSNAEVVKQALNTLTCLCHCCTEETFPKLESVLTRGILTNCFRQTKNIPILICAQRLLVSLVRSEKLLARICTKSENCPLYLMYRACSVVTDGICDLCREFVITLSNLMSAHRSGLQYLLSNSCPCTEELVVAVIMALYNLFLTYKTAETEQRNDIVNTLSQGVTLIHSLAQGDSLFSHHHMSAQLQYKRLLTGVTFILKSNSQLWEEELSILEDFFDIPDASQDSDSESKMDQS